MKYLVVKIEDDTLFFLADIVYKEIWTRYYSYSIKFVNKEQAEDYAKKLDGFVIKTTTHKPRSW